MTLWHRRAALATVTAALGLFLVAGPAAAYPPGVGILGQSRSCASCHKSDGPWSDETRTVIDVLDAKTKRSLKGGDGVFQIEVARGERRTVLTLIGRLPGDAEPPRRNAWLYVDPGQIPTSALSKFAPGWDVNLPMSCRIVGDKVEGYEGAHLTLLPMTVRPTDAAHNAELELQVMLTRGEVIKGEGEKGLVSNFLLRKVRLKVLEP